MKTKTQAKKDKRNYIIVALIVILLLLAVGYASFAQQLEITGTATGNATWNVHFTDESQGTLDKEKHTLTVETELNYPGDAQEVTAQIVNDSTVAAKLKNFTVTSPDGSSDIVLKYVDLQTSLEDEILEPGDTCTYKFVVGWNPTSTKTEVSASYSITFDYEQSTTDKTTTEPTHVNS